MISFNIHTFNSISSFTYNLFIYFCQTLVLFLPNRYKWNILLFKNSERLEASALECDFQYCLPLAKTPTIIKLTNTTQFLKNPLSLPIVVVVENVIICCSRIKSVILVCFDLPLKNHHTCVTPPHIHNIHTHLPPLLPLQLWFKIIQCR